MIKKTKIALGVMTATLTMAGTLVSPQVAAQTQAEKTAALETQLNEMSSMMREMQAELSRVKETGTHSDDRSKVQELDQWMTSVRAAPAEGRTKDHQVSFRGGWSHFNDNRDGTGTLGQEGSALNNITTDRDAYYYGGAIDFNVNNNFFGLADGVSFGMELGLEYAHIGTSKPNGLGVVLGLPGQNEADVNQLRISVAPKIKFMHGSTVRPWLIPAGLDINIISPPSSGITVLNTGMQFGAGVDVELFQGIILGVDGRYHHTFDDIDGVDTDGFTLGGSLGFRF